MVYSDIPTPLISSELISIYDVEGSDSGSELSGVEGSLGAGVDSDELSGLEDSSGGVVG
jgi:hypothetical protein